MKKKKQWKMGKNIIEKLIMKKIDRIPKKKLYLYDKITQHIFDVPVEK